MEKKIRMIHTNDLHSHFENWPKIRRFIHQRQLKQQDESIVTFDLGDFMDRWHPLTEATDGQANIALMNDIHYDAVTIGNNEGIGNDKESLTHLYDRANFDVILANLFDKSTLERPKWAQPFKIITTENDVRIGVIGLTAAFPLTYDPNGWDVRQEMEILPDLVKELRPEVDVLVLLSHLGIEADYLIAREVVGVDIIIGSHTHHLFPNGERENGVQLAAASKFGYYVGEIEVTLSDDNLILETQARTYETAKMLAYPEDQERIDSWVNEGHELLNNTIIGSIKEELSNKPFTYENSLIETTLSAVCDRGNTQAAVLNSGLFLDSIPSGEVTMDHLHRILPHPMHLIRVSLTGQNLIRMVQEMEKNRSFLKHFPILGMGFRGKIFGHICYRGISYDEVNHEVKWFGKPVQLDEMYTFTTVDHFMFIPFFPTIEIAGTVEFLFPEFIRTVLGNYLRKSLKDSGEK